jgi:hypothetical protein
MLIAVDLASDIWDDFSYYGMGIYEKKIVGFILFWYSLI